MDYLKLSKEISYILRHHPEEYNLILDDKGYTDVNQLIKAINNKNEYSKTITLDDIIHVIDISDKKRLDIIDNRIRALYGHSFNNKVKHVEKVPPDKLFHGTSHKFIERILREGLLPMDRQYVHLSIDIPTATIVGKRRDNNPVILQIDSKTAYEDGIKFYIGNDGIWLADEIPVKYIKRM